MPEFVAACLCIGQHHLTRQRGDRRRVEMFADHVKIIDMPH
jgi:hypothetical protein